MNVGQLKLKNNNYFLDDKEIEENAKLEVLIFNGLTNSTEWVATELEQDVYNEWHLSGLVGYQIDGLFARFSTDFENKRIAELAQIAYKKHKKSYDSRWKYGEPIKAWMADDCEICVKYESGEWWHYSELDNDIPTYW